MLQALRDEIGPMPVTSGFRCDAHNNDVSTVKNGPHTLAKAADIRNLRGKGAMKLFEKPLQIGFSGIGLNHKGKHHKRFIHLDTVDRRALWSY